MTFATIFPKKKKALIGAVHLPPSPDYPEFPGMEAALRNAFADLAAFEEGGVDAIIFENNYDVPHTIFVGEGTVAMLTEVGKKLREATKLPLGVSVLWNDYRTALSLAKDLGLQFVRVPVFVDTVETSYGVVKGDAADVVNFRKTIGADEVLLWTDIHVKHATHLDLKPIAATAREAVHAGSDALIITGKWTGDAPDVTDLAEVRRTVGEFPILCGSGVSVANAQTLFGFADGAIVSTSVKEDAGERHERNVKTYEARISAEKTARLVDTLSS